MKSVILGGTYIAIGLLLGVIAGAARVGAANPHTDCVTGDELVAALEDVSNHPRYQLCRIDGNGMPTRCHIATRWIPVLN